MGFLDIYGSENGVQCMRHTDNITNSQHNYIDLNSMAFM